MKNLRTIPAISLISIMIITGCKNQPADKENIYESKADSIIKLMTLEEKVGQLNLLTSDWSSTGPNMRNDWVELIRKGKLGSILNAFTVDYVKSLQKIAVEETRLHIPLLIGFDVIHGHRTIFPIPLGQAASWDLEAIERSDRIAAMEASAEGINWTYAPMVDLARDPRWGRVMEGAGEDTYLGGLIASARVKGFQGNDLLDKRSILACVKHFAAYGAPQAGRDYFTVDMSVRSLYEWYLPPYKSAIDAGAASVMTSFNEIAGVPSTSNKWLLTDLLRNEWKFKGFVVTDYNSIAELINHGVAADASEAGYLSMKAGVDLDMMGSAYLEHLQNLVKAKRISEEEINNAVRRILVAKYKLGLFDNPYKYCDTNREKTEIMTREYLDFARKFASESCVLLKNDNRILPIKNDVRTIALIGPLSNSKRDMLGSWSGAGDPAKCVTLLEGLINRAGKSITITTAKGCDVSSDRRDDIAQAVALARKADFVILALGESSEMTGEAASRSDIGLPGVQLELAGEVIKTGRPVAVVLFNGRPLVIPELSKIAPAILEAWFGGTEAGNAVADILFGDFNPSGKLTMSFPRNVGQIPIFYNCKNTGRPINPEMPFEKYKSNYLDVLNTPLYPFGYGLSYTSFTYSDIKMKKSEFRGNEQITASIDIKNTGDRDGVEIVQLYIRDLVGEVTRPVKELKGFKKVFIKKGETANIVFSLAPDELSYYHQDMSFKYDPGDFELFIGPNSEELRNIRFSIIE